MNGTRQARLIKRQHGFYNAQLIITERMDKMNKSDMWITLLASVGVGAAAYYTISKSNKPVDKAIESVVPMFSSMSNNQNNQSNQYSQNDTQTLGPHGMS